MIGELWDDPRDEVPDEDLDDDPDALDDESDCDEELEIWKVIERYVPAELNEGC